MKVSIVTVCRNAADTIEQTVQSILRQTCGMNQIEYIVIDGASTDATKDILEKYKKHFSYYISEPDNGLYDAMNKGIKVASGDIIGILNADDWYEDDAIECVVKHFDNSDADIVYGKMNLVEANGMKRMEFQQRPLDELWYTMVINHPATFVKRAVYEKCGLFLEEFKIAADYEFVLRCYARGCKFSFVDKVLTNYRTGGVSDTKHLLRAHENREIYEKYLEFAPDKERMRREHEYILKRAIFEEKCDKDKKAIISVLMEKFPQIRDGIVIWGTGVWGHKCFDMFVENHIMVKFWIDSAETKIGKMINGLDVKSPEVLKGLDEVVLIAMKSEDINVRERIREFGVEYKKCVFLNEWIDMVVVRGENA